MTISSLVVFSCACGPSPRPVTPSLENGWPTVLGSARRAPYEHEVLRDSLDVVWDIDAGAGLRSSVLLTDSALFVGTTNRVLFAFATRTGRRHWYQRVEGEIPGAVVRSGRTLFLATSEWNGKVHARDMERGRKRWSHDAGPTRFAPLFENGLLYVGDDRGFVHALQSEDGDRVWRTPLNGGVAATPLSHGDAIVVASVRDSLYRLAKRDGSIQARKPIPSSVSAPPALSGDTIILVTHSGAVLGVHASTLAPLWRVETGEPILAAPIVARDGTIHILNRDAVIWRITGGRGTRVAKLDGSATSSFTLARDRYVLGLVDGTLVVTDMDGSIVTQHKFNDSVAAPIAVRDGALYVPLLRGRIVKLR